MKKLMTLACALTAFAAIVPMAQTAGTEKPGFASPVPRAVTALARSSSLTPMVNADTDFGRMPLYFIANKGQLDDQVAYYVQGKDKTLYFTPGGVTFALSRADNAGDKRSPLVSRDRSMAESSDAARVKAQDSASGDTERCVVKLDFVGANHDVRPVGQEETGAVVIYFRGQPKDWHTGLATYSGIIYSDLWAGIDLAYSGTADRLKYEFVIHPGVDPAAIRLAYRGVTDLKVNDIGRLVVATPTGSFEDDAPVAYQVINGRRVAVPLAYRILKNDGRAAGGEKGKYLEKNRSAAHGGAEISESRDYGFRVGAYDASQPLILDPAVLVYCGHVGGSAAERVRGIAVDSSGCAYVTGQAYSDETTFPVAVGPSLTGYGDDAFVAKVKADGSGLVYCGFIGGYGFEYGDGIAVDSTGAASPTFSWPSFPPGTRGRQTTR